MRRSVRLRRVVECKARTRVGVEPEGTEGSDPNLHDERFTEHILLVWVAGP